MNKEKNIGSLEKLVLISCKAQDMIWQLQQQTNITERQAEQQYFRKFFINYRKQDISNNKLSYENITNDTYNQFEKILGEYYKQGE